MSAQIPSAWQGLPNPQIRFDELTQEIKTLLKQLAGQPLELINIQNSNKELADWYVQNPRYV